MRPMAGPDPRHARAEPLRIAILGAECSGKTTLARALAERWPSIRVAERLREFCEARRRTPQAHEQAALMSEQIEIEERALARARERGIALVLCDSTPLATALYSVALFGDESLLARALAHQRGYALTLRTAIDLRWEADGIMRDGPLARETFDALLTRVLREHRIDHATLEGGREERLLLASEAIAGLGIPYNPDSR